MFLVPHELYIYFIDNTTKLIGPSTLYKDLTLLACWL